MGDRTDDHDAIRSLLDTPRRIAVVGASDNPQRDSRRIFTYLRDKGHDVLPVNPAYDEVAGVATVPDLGAAAEHWGNPPEIVDVFRAPEHVPDVVDAAIAVEAPWLWLQLGVVHDEATQRALDAGMDVVVDRCIFQEAERLLA